MVVDGLSTGASVVLAYPLYWLGTNMIASHELRALPSFGDKLEWVRVLLETTYRQEGAVGFYKGVLPLLGCSLTSGATLAGIRILFTWFTEGAIYFFEPAGNGQPDGEEHFVFSCSKLFFFFSQLS